MCVSNRKKMMPANNGNVRKNGEDLKFRNMASHFIGRGRKTFVTQ
jgi:hypothetical protein